MQLRAEAQNDGDGDHPELDRRKTYEVENEESKNETVRGLAQKAKFNLNEDESEVLLLSSQQKL